MNWPHRPVPAQHKTPGNTVQQTKVYFGEEWDQDAPIFCSKWKIKQSLGFTYFYIHSHGRRKYQWSSSGLSRKMHKHLYLSENRAIKVNIFITRATNYSVRQPLRIVEFSPYKSRLSFARIVLLCRMASRKWITFYLSEIVFKSICKAAISRLSNAILLFGIWEKRIGWESENLPMERRRIFGTVNKWITGHEMFFIYVLKSHSTSYWCFQRISEDKVLNHSKGLKILFPFLLFSILFIHLLIKASLSISFPVRCQHPQLPVGSFGSPPPPLLNLFLSLSLDICFPSWKCSGLSHRWSSLALSWRLQTCPWKERQEGNSKVLFLSPSGVWGRCCTSHNLIIFFMPLLINVIIS